MLNAPERELIQSAWVGHLHSERLHVCEDVGIAGGVDPWLHLIETFRILGLSLINDGEVYKHGVGCRWISIETIIKNIGVNVLSHDAGRLGLHQLLELNGKITAGIE